MQYFLEEIEFKYLIYILRKIKNNIRPVSQIIFEME